MRPRLRELIPIMRGSHQMGSQNPGPIFLTIPEDTVVKRCRSGNVFGVDRAALFHKKLDASHVLWGPQRCIPVDGVHQAVDSHGSLATVQESWLPLQMRFDAVKLAHEAILHPLRQVRSCRGCPVSQIIAATYKKYNDVYFSVKPFIIYSRLTDERPKLLRLRPFYS